MDAGVAIASLESVQIAIGWMPECTNGYMVRLYRLVHKTLAMLLLFRYVRYHSMSYLKSTFYF